MKVLRSEYRTVGWDHPRVVAEDGSFGIFPRKQRGKPEWEYQPLCKCDKCKRHRRTGFPMLLVQESWRSDGSMEDGRKI